LFFPRCSSIRRRYWRIFSYVDKQTTAIKPQRRWPASFRSAFWHAHVVGVRVHGRRFVPVSPFIVPLDRHARRDALSPDRNGRQQRWPGRHLVAPVGHGRCSGRIPRLPEHRRHHKLRSNADQPIGKEPVKRILGRRIAVSS